MNSLATWFVDLRDLQGPLATLIRIVFILLATWIAMRVTARLTRLFRVRIAARLADAEQVRRAETLGRAFRYVATAFITLLAVVLLLDEVGISVAPILGAAGVVGLAVGFGAQSLVKDYFTGMFLLLENQIRRGDVVRIADRAGLVEDLTLRYVQLRDFEGNVHFVPNNLITTVTNMSRGFAYAVVDVGIAYREDIDTAGEQMRAVGAEMRADASMGPRIIDDFEWVGVERLDDSAVVLRGRLKVRPLEQWNVRREYFRRIKYAFDAAGIEIPYPHLTLYAGASKSGETNPFRIEGRQA
jgi:moderate conductance mechanosensitive channel